MQYLYIIIHKSNELLENFDFFKNYFIKIHAKQLHIYKFYSIIFL
jgi:hypothetical protein